MRPQGKLENAVEALRGSPHPLSLPFLGYAVLETGATRSASELSSRVRILCLGLVLVVPVIIACVKDLNLTTPSRYRID